MTPTVTFSVAVLPCGSPPVPPLSAAGDEQPASPTRAETRAAARTLRIRDLQVREALSEHAVRSGINVAVTAVSPSWSEAACRPTAPFHWVKVERASPPYDGDV